MNIILFHVGNDIPNHIVICLRQLRHTNPNIKVWFLHNQAISQYIYPLVREFNIESVIVDINDFTIIDEYMNFHSNFWNVTMKRIPIMAKFAKEKQLEDIIIFENDVLIYHDINNIIHWLSNQVEDCGLTRGTPNDVMTGFAYFKNFNSLSRLSDFILTELNTYTVGDFVNEMNLLSKFASIHGNSYNIPTLPYQLNHKLSMEPYPYIIMPFIFDPAAWGQYVGGTPHNGKTPGWAENAHYIGKEILNGRYNVVWINKKPYVKDLKSETFTPLFNLHIHSKDLHKYVSY